MRKKSQPFHQAQVPAGRNRQRRRTIRVEMEPVTRRMRSVDSGCFGSSVAAPIASSSSGVGTTLLDETRQDRSDLSEIHSTGPPRPPLCLPAAYQEARTAAELAGEKTDASTCRGRNGS